MGAFINSIGTANPEYRIRQQDVLNFMINAHSLSSEESKKLEVLYRATGIQHRYSTIRDYNDNGEFIFFRKNGKFGPLPTTRERSDWYKNEALELSLKAVQHCIPNQQALKQVTHLITVSCTGMYAPGLDIDLVENLGLPTSVERTSINFMGCYAAFNALKLAAHICNSQEASVLIVCTELCSLHFQNENTEDNFLSNAIFGDGSAAVLVQTDQHIKDSLRIDGFQCQLIPQSKKEMAWEIGDHGFEMKLSNYVPEILTKNVKPFLDSIFESRGSSFFDLYAIHPGGKKILQVVEQSLGISKSENSYSHQILKEYGNMSSPTILFILKAILDNEKHQNQDRSVLGLAFGPGLTVESMCLTLLNS